MCWRVRSVCGALTFAGPASTRRQNRARHPTPTPILAVAAGWSRCRARRFSERQAFGVRDLVFVLLTLAVFAVLWLTVRAVEKL
jgi:hypothetical protein